MSPALRAAHPTGPHQAPATPAGRPARVRRLPPHLPYRRLLPFLALLCGALLAVVAALGATGTGGPSGAEPRPASAPAVPDPAGETSEPGAGEAGLPGRTRHRRTRVRPVPAPPGPRRSRTPPSALPAAVPAPRTPAHRRVVMRC
ncbi:hypothetical protein GCM10010363_18390 [Streptomyces omiyaensis]|uniref:hypothetical protein n=1 Tax=Streptomyces omiyaensis TaxID=68247 RepID=UPI00167AC84C|nr:hypothetical protein [Streptomyces omiyaensis]GGY37970.1 hypothetical protein GCM10010363_18390 [Streptomyces omiyaensis]